MVIPVAIFRALIQDNPVAQHEGFYLNGGTGIINLTYYPVYENGDIVVTINQNSLTEQDYSINYTTGQLRLLNSEEGQLEIFYESVNLTDDELIYCLENALMRHDPTVTLDDMPSEYAPFVQWLAAASAYYMLAAKWASNVRTRVETIEVHEQQKAARYFALGERMEKRYYEASAGIIDVQTVTRRDVFTGLLVLKPEDVYAESN